MLAEIGSLPCGSRGGLGLIYAHVFCSRMARACREWIHCLRRFRTLKGPSHFSLLAQRKVTQRNGLKGSRHGKDKSLDAYI